MLPGRSRDRGDLTILHRVRLGLELQPQGQNTRCKEFVWEVFLYVEWLVEEILPTKEKETSDDNT